ncbi:FG-GAP-like repeat-containing protein [Virgisporangium aurantiacum]|nr:FG-GAP-like repeat-containing protein [Virgisporangium aurantiacum]
MTLLPRVPAEAADTDPLPREPTAAVGALEGTHGVTNDGHATYTVPIVAPPGIADLSPSIALSYTSGARDGVAGEGWEVSGFSAIERCALASAQSDGYARPVGDPAGRPDAFCLDGQLLVVVRGTYGADGSEYRTEVDSHTRIVLSRPGGAAIGPAGFEVRRKDGRILRYGFAADAIEVWAGASNRRWAVKEEQDRNGNYLEMVYARACTGPAQAPTCTRSAPSEVRYGGHRSSGTGARAHDRSIRFVYEDRADGWMAHTHGMRELEWRRINRIETVVGGTVVRRYKFEYDARQDVSRLLRLRECVDDPTAEVCKPPTTFTYDNSQGFSATPTNGPAVSSMFGNGLGSYAVGRTIVLDANGDGLDDLVYPAPTARYTCDPALNSCSGSWTYRLALATGDRTNPYTVRDTGLGSQPSLGFTFWCISQDSVIDYNGDNRDDLVSTCDGHTQGKVLVSTGTGFTQEQIPVIPTAQVESFWLADLNGDALADVLRCQSASLLLYLNRGPGLGFEAARTLPNYGHQGLSPLTGITGGPPEPCEAPMFVDFDADGVVNALKRQWTFDSSPNPQTFVWTETWEALSIDATGARWSEPVLTFNETIDASLPAPEDIYDLTPYWAGDVTNTDPGDDSGQVTATTYARKWQMRVLDVDGDGLDDILRYDGTQANPVRVHINAGKGFTSPMPTLVGDPAWDWYRVSAYSFARAQFVDYDNDGRDDVLMPIGDPRQPANLRWVVHKTQDRATTRPELVGTMNLAERSLPVRGDVDGDGSSDLILVADAPGLVDQVGNPAGQLTIRWGNHARGNFLVSARDGMGETITFDYSATNAAGNRTYQRTTFCQSRRGWCLNRAGPLVSSVQVRVAERQPGVPTETFRRISFQRITYQDGKRAWYGRGNLGFARRVTTTWGEADTDVIESVTSDYDNTTYLNTTTGSPIRHWYPNAGRLTNERIVSAGVTEGLDTPRTVQRIVETGPIRYAVKLSPESVPFAVEESRSSTVTAQRSSADIRGVRSSLTSTAYDGDGNLTSTNTLVRNGSGAEIERTVEENTYDATPSRRTNWLIGLRTRVKTTHTRQGRTEVRTTAFTYTAGDRALPFTSVREPDDPVYRTSEMGTHDEYGHVISQQMSATGLGTRTTQFSYDMATLFPTRETNPMGHVTQLVTDTRLGTVLVRVDPNGVVTRSAYDGFGRLARERGPNGDTVTTYARVDTDTSANPRARVRTTKLIAGGATSTEFQDALGRTVETRANGYAGTTVVTESTFDFAGRPLTVSRPHLPNDTSQGATRNIYDALGRLVTTQRPDDNATGGIATTNVRYGGPDEAPSAAAFTAEVRASAADAVAVTDPLGRRTVQVKDVDEALVATVDAAGSVTQVEYGPFGAARRIVNPRGSVTTFETDRWGRTTAVASGDTGRHTYTWTAYGQLAQHTDPRGQTTQNVYDQLGRITRRTDPRGIATWRYDGPGPNAIGKLTQVSNPEDGFTQLSYEPVPASGPNRGLLAATEQTIDGRSYRLGYGYDQFGRNTRLEYPGAAGEAFGVTYAYDAGGLLTAVRDATTNNPYWTFVDDDQGYRVGVERLGNNVTTTSRFQPLSGRPLSVVAAGSAGTVQNLEYGYDAVGSVKHMRDGVRADRSRSYTYDTVNRLTQTQLLTGNNPATPGQVDESFAYDTAGNFTSKSGVGTYTYRPATDILPHAPITAGQNAYSWDAAGNQVGRTGPGVAGGRQAVTWSPANLPTSISLGTGPGLTTTFRYNAAEERVQRRAPDATTTYVSGLYERREPAGGGTTEHRYYVRAGDKTVAQVVKTESSGTLQTRTVTYEHPDRLGSPLDHSDPAAARGHSQRFTAYGANLDPNWRVTGERGFTGHDHDADLGLIDMDGRLYDPVLGRFLSADPSIVGVTEGPAPADRLVARVAEAGAPGGGTAPTMAAADLLQPYGYAANNPLAYLDPDGRDPRAFYKIQAAVEQIADAVRDSTLGEAAAGFTAGVALSAVPGGSIAGAVLSIDPPSRTFEFARGAGEAVYGVGQFVAGAFGTAGGGALTVTGAGAPAGVPVVAVSTGAMAEAAIDVASGVATMMHAAAMPSDGGPTGGGEGTAGTVVAAPPAAVGGPASGNGPPTLTASSRPDSSVLGRNIEAKTRVKRPEGSAAHHIVAGKGRSDASAPARAVLEKHGIDINSAENGVFLPANSTSPNPTGATVHSTLHHEAYYANVNDWIRNADIVGGREAVLRTLNDIRTMLETGTWVD